jgi:hypothetical protein
VRLILIMAVILVLALVLGGVGALDDVAHIILCRSSGSSSTCSYAS